jgi:serine protease Do
VVSSLCQNGRTMNPISFPPFVRRLRLGLAAVAVGSGLLATGVVVARESKASSATKANAAPTVQLQVDAQPIAPGPFEPKSFRDIAQRVSPSVVKITTESRPRPANARGGPQDLGQLDPFFRQFFGDRVPQLRQPPSAGLGSGVIISADGYVATNNHVIDNADIVTVTLADNREFRATVVGRDPQTDLALLKVDTTGLPAVTFAESSQVSVGDRVLAIGNPYGLGGTVTTGIVSATSRRAGLGLAYEDFIQTDAAINPGNSGGALVDLEGRLIGLNTAILSRSGGFQGIGLAVPSDLVRHVVNNLAQHGKVVRGFLGVTVQNMTPALASTFNLESSEGALVSEVTPKSPADQAGLRSGDIITRIDGRPVNDSARLSLAIGQTAPGQKVELEVLRDGKTRTLTAQVEPQPDNQGRRDRSGGLSRIDPSDDGVLNGVGVADLDPRSRRQYQIPARVEGALIVEVAPDSPSARAGLKPGDVILEINRQPITSADEAVQHSAEATERRTLVKLWSRGGTIYTVVDETEAQS